MPAGLAWRRPGPVEAGAPVAAVTGSNGKTTTKAFLAAAFHGDRRAVASPGNRNSRWGMPAAILSFSGDEDVLVLEMGASAPGEIGRLAAGHDLDVVPCYLDGGMQAWPKGKLLPRPGRLHLRIGRARNFGHLDGSPESVKAVCADLRRCVSKLGGEQE